MLFIELSKNAIRIFRILLFLQIKISVGKNTNITSSVEEVTDNDGYDELFEDFSYRKYGDSANTKRLTHHLLDLYNTLETPISNFSNPLTITVKLDLVGLIKVSETENAIQTSILLHLTWKDYNMEWNSSEFGNVSSLRVPKHRMWSPDIRFLNQFADQADMTVDTNNIVLNDGTVTRVSPGLISTSCATPILDYPFQNHKCQIKIGSWSYYRNEIILLKQKTGENLQDVVPNIHWDVLGFDRNMELDDNESVTKSYITYEINLRRKGLPILYSAYLLNFVICSIIFMSILLSPSSTHKLNFGIFGIILCIFTEMRFHLFCFGLDDSSPPRLAIYFQRLLEVNLVCLFTNVIAFYLYQKKGPMPDLIKSFLIKILPILKHIIRTEMEKTTEEIEMSNNSKSSTMQKSKFAAVIDNLTIRRDKIKEQDLSRIMNDWEFFAVVLDRFFFGFWTIFLPIFVAIAFPSYSIYN